MESVKIARLELFPNFKAQKLVFLVFLDINQIYKIRVNFVSNVNLGLIQFKGYHVKNALKIHIQIKIFHHVCLTLLINKNLKY